MKEPTAKEKVASLQHFINVYNFIINFIKTVVSTQMVKNKNV